MPTSSTTATHRHEYAPHCSGEMTLASCCCGWHGVAYYGGKYSREEWLEHAVAAYQAEEVAVCDDDEVDCCELAGDEVAGVEVRE